VTVLAAGSAVPQFTLRREDGTTFTRDDLVGRTTVLVFYPFAFSEVCTDQFQVYEEVVDELTAAGATVYGLSTDAPDSQRAFRESLGLTIPMLSDFEPKGATARAFGTYFEAGGMATRALVIVGPDARVRWSWIGEHPGVMPGANLIFDALAAKAT
jgi:peroxiredoxin